MTIDHCYWKKKGKFYRRRRLRSFISYRYASRRILPTLIHSPDKKRRQKESKREKNIDKQKKRIKTNTVLNKYRGLIHGFQREF